MSKIKRNDLEILISNNGEVKEYKAKLDSLLPPDGQNEEYQNLIKKLKSAIVLKESLKNSISSFIRLRKYYNDHTGFYDNTVSLEAHALFTHGALLYRAGFVNGRFVGRPADNLSLVLKDNDAHVLLRDYVDKKMAHADIDHDMKTRDIRLSLRTKGKTLEVGSLFLSGDEVHSYNRQTLEYIISHISSVADQVDIEKNKIVQKMRELFGQILIQE